MRFFERGSPMAELERQMMMVPNFTPRGHGSAVLCAAAAARYGPQVMRTGGKLV